MADESCRFWRAYARAAPAQRKALGPGGGTGERQIFAELSSSRSALITGLGTGIGAAVARGFGRYGAKFGLQLHHRAETAQQVAAAARERGDFTTGLR